MSVAESIETPVEVAAENIGGIDSTRVSLEPGINVLTGRNATNRTSFLQAIMAALGSDRPSLKGDADEGSVELSFDDGHYRRSLYRRNDTVVFDGEPYLEEPELADLFAFLLESNEARRAVSRGDDLRELIMRPIDTDEIQAEIRQLEDEKREIDDRLDHLDDLKNELPGLEERRVSIDDEIENLEAELEEVEAELEELDADVEESQSRKEELESTFADLRSARRELESIEYDLETERESRTELENERDRLETDLDDLTDEEDGDESPERLQGRVQELRERKRDLDTTLNELQSVIRFNEERLEDGGIDLGDTMDEDDAVTDRLLAGDSEVVCWTCGSEVERDAIESTLERLQELHQSKLADRNDLQEKIDDLTSRQKELRQRQNRRERLEERLDSIEDDLAAHGDRIDDLEDERSDQEQRVEELEDDTESFDDTDYSEVLEAHRDANGLEIEIENLEGERTEVDDRIAELEATIEEREELDDRREEITDELADLRTRVDRIEDDAVEAFNEHMSSILSILDYANIDRIWIERREGTVKEGRRKVERTAFDLHVIRSTADGTSYEDRIEHLSESEREVTGLVFALAGYLVHDVYEQVPFMLLDSLEAIDSDRIAALVEYFETYADCLVVALLPEDASALDDAHNYVTEI
ncbi:archaea-specific SMC-related protein [Saliphagus infecundisoli]|uniref:Archaea-specific SMC-related protein n=1 Tax=Saliphagus infecundisoli TaxID=1849069 RepID=A0ABD5QJJ1_9EURY|nr:archaea-specific SMC-related protein [Saliphagus infecundisoli]